MNETINRIIKNPKFTPVATGVVSLGIGFALGYFIGKNHKREIHIAPKMKAPSVKEIDDFIKEEREKLKLIKEAKTVEEVRIELEDDEDETYPEEVEEESEEETEAPSPSRNEIGARYVEERLKKTIQTHQGSPPVEPIAHSIFAGTTTEWDYDEELKKRTNAIPYVLHKDEFYGEEKRDEGYSQTTLTYYAGDDIMCNEDDTPMYNYSSIVGELKFGHGSDDPKVFYVRNCRRKAEYEIIHDPGIFSVEVLGLEIENNDRVKALQKFRDTD